eukprot:CAMPEP_0203808682 /NCGR_PEP_ID=MMETSP0115-20131106/1754_1 /ASSEMBLY_ACC=CAM_ASM_000227 /TAXON_ID=33651 /ORGANISM="Bicosoecid sp, Strain ms1" /LENGTH=56 /DNA_ID=CAMNT_0050717375 /DNA_START=129 /DNA_END=296 /DNA_ORIENTATION=-
MGAGHAAAAAVAGVNRTAAARRADRGAGRGSGDGGGSLRVVRLTVVAALKFSAKSG